MSRVDWPGLLRAGLADLRLEPEVFWRLTPVELRIMLGVDRATPALTRARLDELARAYPDKKKAETDDGNRGSFGTDRGAGSVPGGDDDGGLGL